MPQNTQRNQPEPEIIWSPGYDAFAYELPQTNPYWIRPPKSGYRCPWTGLSHGGFYGKIHDHREEFIYMKLNSKTKSGTFLYWLPLIRFQLLGLLQPDVPENLEFDPYAPQKAKPAAPRDNIFPHIQFSMIRAPTKKGRCPWTGLSESSFRNLRNQLFNKREIYFGAVSLPEFMRRMLKISHIPEAVKNDSSNDAKKPRAQQL